MQGSPLFIRPLPVVIRHHPPESGVIKDTPLFTRDNPRSLSTLCQIRIEAKPLDSLQEYGFCRPILLVRQPVLFAFQQRYPQHIESVLRGQPAYALPVSGEVEALRRHTLGRGQP